MIERSICGRLEGREVAAFTLTNARGTRAKVLELGCRIAELHLAGREGRQADIVLGYDELAGHAADASYFGAICGRYANRIAGGKFILDGRTCRVTCNEGANHLHGGAAGFDRKLWTGALDADGRTIRFSCSSPDGDEGFPGRLDVRMRLSLDDEDRFSMELTAETDRPTICNLAHHGYWNLAGHASGDVLGQRLTLDAPFFTPVDAALIPTGEIRSVAGTDFDFTVEKPIGRDSRGEFDFNAVLAGEARRLRRAARAFDPVSGRGFELWTDQPGVQLYTGLHLGPGIIGKGGHPYCRHAGFALETQHFPDSPNRPHFPSCRLDPGETYRHRMEFRFFAA